MRFKSGANLQVKNLRRDFPGREHVERILSEYEVDKGLPVMRHPINVRLRDLNLVFKGEGMGHEDAGNTARLMQHQYHFISRLNERLPAHAPPVLGLYRTNGSVGYLMRRWPIERVLDSPISVVKFHRQISDQLPRVVNEMHEMAGLYHHDLLNGVHVRTDNGGIVILDPRQPGRLERFSYAIMGTRSWNDEQLERDDRTLAQFVTKMEEVLQRQVNSAVIDIIFGGSMNQSTRAIIEDKSTRPIVLDSLRRHHMTCPSKSARASVAADLIERNDLEALKVLMRNAH